VRGIAAIALILLAAAAGTAGADIYSWTDAEGVVHFSDKPKGKGTWKKVLREDPAYRSKAAAERGSCERCDIVPARDRDPNRYSRYDEYIYEAAELYQIPVALIRAVIKVESDYDPRVVSAMNARGLMQLMPEVIQDMGVRNVHDPRENILGGTRLLRVLANRFDGDLVLTIAGYHAGMGALARYGNNVPPYQYTRIYVKLVLKQYYRFKDLEGRKRDR
jgi:soluble lytic murein transglycosylase-like protein